MRSRSPREKTAAATPNAEKITVCYTLRRMAEVEVNPTTTIYDVKQALSELEKIPAKQLDLEELYSNSGSLADMRTVAESGITKKSRLAMRIEYDSDATTDGGEHP